ncbi:MAG: hypothetical protein P8X92_09140, partial [Dehalococcoidia bacterium]
MRILTINVLGIPSGVSSNLATANVFQDYDTVVINPQTLDSLYYDIRIEYFNREEKCLTSKTGIILENIHDRRRKEVTALLERGGIVVCFMCPEVSYSYEREWQGKDENFYITNYDWVTFSREKELGTILSGTGINIHYIDLGHPFSAYLNTKPSWTAYVEKSNCEGWKVLASAFDTHVLALTKRVGLGHIVLLPSYYDYHNGKLLEQCIIKLMGHPEPRPQPNWAKSIMVPDQESIISEITEVNEQAV